MNVNYASAPRMKAIKNFALLSPVGVPASTCTTRSGLMPQSDTSHQHQRCLCLRSPRGRLRYADRLRRPRWRNRNLKLTFHLDHSVGADQSLGKDPLSDRSFQPRLPAAFFIDE